MAEEEEGVDEERATYRRALEDIESAPPAPTDPYGSVVARFGQLAPHVRLFLQKLSTDDVRTLARTIINLQRTGTVFRRTRIAIGWGVAAFTAAVLAGEKLVKALEWLGIMR